MRLRILAPLLAAFVFTSAQPVFGATPPALVKHAHVGMPLPGPDRMPAPLAPQFASKLRTMKALTPVGAASALTPPVGGAIPFITRPYMNYHVATSVFDHCNPDYTTDGKVCEYDGTVALASNGRDPGFSLGYAITPGGHDYLYYDGHNGWDLALYYENIMASAEGVVRIAGIDSVNPCFGTNIVIDHPNGFSTRYAHLSKLYVAVGASVTRGQVIGQSGNTGCSTGAHLHFGVYVTSSWTAIDPFGWTGAPGADPWPSDQGDLWLTGMPANPLPYAPTAVTAVAGFQSALVSWQPPSFDGGSGIGSYTVTASPGGSSATAAGTATSATVSGLTTGTAYTFTVTAMNNVGAGPASAPSNSVVPQSVPDPPTNVVATAGNLSATVSWSPPAMIGGSAITGYNVASAGVSLTVPGTQTQVQVPQLSGSSYRFTVSATNASGTGLPSAASNPVAPYPFRAMYTLDGFGVLHPDGATREATVTASWPGWKIARAATLLPDASGGYVLDGFGGVHSFRVGSNPLPANVTDYAYWSGWDIARDVVLLPTSTASQPQGYTLDGWGGVHRFGGAPVARTSAYWQGFDIARRMVLLADGSGGYVMDGYGGLHAFAVGSNPMPPAVSNYAYWPGWNIARHVVLLPGSTAANVGGATLDGFGGVHAFGNAGSSGISGFAYWSGWDIARSVRLSPASTANHVEGWTLDGFGGVHAFGGAPNVPMSAYWNSDIAVNLVMN